MVGDNPYMELTPDELAAECLAKAGDILNRPHRTKAGDAIAQLLLACAATLNPPETE